MTYRLNLMTHAILSYCTRKLAVYYMLTYDLILLSRSESGLQTCLNKLKVYCDEWNLRVNIKKSKILIFNKTGKLIESHFVLGTDKLESVRTYIYLGIEITASGSFEGAVKRLCDKAKKGTWAP